MHASPYLEASVTGLREEFGLRAHNVLVDVPLPRFALDRQVGVLALSEQSGSTIPVSLSLARCLARAGYFGKLYLCTPRMSAWGTRSVVSIGGGWEPNVVIVIAVSELAQVSCKKRKNVTFSNVLVAGNGVAKCL